jgi:hypothetical protein
MWFPRFMSHSGVAEELVPLGYDVVLLGVQSADS